MIVLKGLYTALVTPFNKRGNIDYKALKILLTKQIEAKVAGIVLLGTTGEAPTISETEKEKLIKFVISIIQGKLQLILGMGSNNTKSAVVQTMIYSRFDIDALLVSVPAYNKPTEKGLIEHFTKIANVSKVPIILYNVPSRTGTSLTENAIRILSKHNNIIGIKEASGNMWFALDVSKYIDDKFALLSGCDELSLPLLSIGAAGSISVASNVIPVTIKSIIDQYHNNEKQAQIINALLIDFYKACFVETNPIPIKYMLAKQKIIKNKVRPPLTTLSPSKRKSVNVALNKMLEIENKSSK